MRQYICRMRWNIAQWFEQHWWKRYLKDKKPSEYLQWKENYWLNFLESIGIQKPINLKILDAGCGPAGINIILKGNRVTALDPLITGYEATLPHFKKSAYPWVDFQSCALEDLNADEKFDVIFCLNVINHVKNINKAYDSLIENLKKEGLLILSIDSHNYTLPKWLFRLLPLDILHPHQFDLKEYQNALLKKGISIKQSVRIKSGFLFDYYAIVGEKT